MCLVFPRNLLGGFLCFQRFQPHPGFEGCVVSPAFGFHWQWSSGCDWPLPQAIAIYRLTAGPNLWVHLNRDFFPTAKRATLLLTSV